MKTTIRKKILTAFLSVCVVSVIAVGLVNVITLNQIRDMTEEASRDLGAIAAKNSSESLEQLALSGLQTLTNETASGIDERFESYVDDLSLMVHHVETLYENPSAFVPAPVRNYLDIPDGELAMHWFLEPIADVTGTNDGAALSASGLLDETYLLGNAERIFGTMMKIKPEITSIYIATESGQNLQFDAAVAQKAEVIGSDLVIHDRPWYVAPSQSGELYISDTYRDLGGRGLNITMSSPIYVDGVFKGVLGFDILVDDLDKQLSEMAINGSGWVELLGKDKVISAPDLTVENEYELPPFWDALQATDSGNTTSVIDGEKVFVVWNALPLTGWKLCYIMPERDVTGPAEDTHEQIVALSGKSAEDMSKNIGETILVIGVLLLFVIILAVIVAIFVSRRLSGPIMQLTADAEDIGAGALDRVLTASTGDEIEALAHTINDMVSDIKRVTGEKERIGAELAVATEIQASMLPSIFPPFPERSEIDLYASMLPAKEVAGDFYDFFMVGDDTLAIVIADVSGKGVPSALFMVIAKTLIKNNAQMGKSPKEVFETVNDILCENNEASMFVTGFMAYLDLLTGELTCVNAGHNPPLLTREGKFEWVKIKRGFVLAGMENMTYSQETLTMAPGDTLYVYTDGVTEAMDKDGALWGDERLKDALDRYTGVSSSQDLTVSIKDEIDRFADGAEQADDITMLALRYKEGVQSV
ncbi:MAG: SpoIIE family protein phosphatase [Clostridiales Family XIII bacterium]|jgi:sigma-B regulation protein RsbU (phosphoserine phosphatase)|nr:SpoIIE family protein phosphatase [Clostridiales Family XIII bacterium]